MQGGSTNREIRLEDDGIGFDAAILSTSGRNSIHCRGNYRQGPPDRGDLASPACRPFQLVDPDGKAGAINISDRENIR